MKTIKVKNRLEFVAALFAGYTLRNVKTGEVAKLTQTDIFMYTDSAGHMLTDMDYENWEGNELPRWYEFIPAEGVLCHVSCSVSDVPRVRLIVECKILPDNILSFKDESGVLWSIASPLTEKEVKSITLRTE